MKPSLEDQLAAVGSLASSLWLQEARRGKSEILSLRESVSQPDLLALFFSAV